MIVPGKPFWPGVRLPLERGGDRGQCLVNLTQPFPTDNEKSLLIGAAFVSVVSSYRLLVFCPLESMVMNDRIIAAETRSWLDSLGAAVSIACAVQCALFPLLISVLPFPLLVSVLPFLGPRFLLGGGLEKALLVMAGILAFVGFGWGFLFHRRGSVFLFLIAAFLLIFTGRMWVENPYQIPFIVSGSLLLATGHIVNIRLCRSLVICRASRPQTAANPAVLTSSSA
jgi:hypothetical protein